MLETRRGEEDEGLFLLVTGQRYQSKAEAVSRAVVGDSHNTTKSSEAQHDRPNPGLHSFSVSYTLSLSYLDQAVS